MLTSKDHDRDAADEAAAGGTGWTSASAAGTASGGRARSAWTGCSRSTPADVRREGAALDRATFDRVVVAARDHHAIG